MEIVSGVLNVIKGERFSQKIGGVDYDQCSQIVIKLYNDFNPEVCLYWVKEASPDYPGAGTVSKTEDPDMQLSIFIKTDDLIPGKYQILAMREIKGVNAPVLKNRKALFILSKE